MARFLLAGETHLTIVLPKPIFTFGIFHSDLINKNGLNHFKKCFDSDWWFFTRAIFPQAMSGHYDNSLPSIYKGLKHKVCFFAILGRQ